jgi:Secretion system C-terminal sorting domain
MICGNNSIKFFNLVGDFMAQPLEQCSQWHSHWRAGCDFSNTDQGAPLDLNNLPLTDYSYLLANWHNTIFDNNPYINNTTTGHWVGIKNVYAYLDKDIELRNSDMVFTNFYNQYKDLALGKIINADKAIFALINSYNKLQFNLLVPTTEDRNDEISSNNSYEQNEQIVNDWLIKVLKQGISSLTTSEKNGLQALANSCPFEAGTAVFKARALYAHYEPAMQYDDRVICMISNGNRTSQQFTASNIDSILFAEDSKAMGLSVEDRFAKLKNTYSIGNEDAEESKIIETILYPNPSNEKINIIKACPNKGELNIFNALGEIVDKIILKEGKVKEVIDISKLNNGFYVCKINILNCPTSTFKIQIIH